MMAEVVYPEHTYCVPGRLISDNITLINVSSSWGVATGLISIDQEDHHLWKTLAAYGFNSGFIAWIQVLYRGVASILKIHGGLAAPFIHISVLKKELGPF